jgi:hypothetical protein
MTLPIKEKKIRRYPDFDFIETSHLLDSIWVKKDRSELKIVFATGQILEFRPILEREESL